MEPEKGAFINGPSVILMTPFKKNFDLDLENIAPVIRYLVDSGIKKGKGHVIGPSGSGDYANLTTEELMQQTEAIVKAADGDIPVIAGVPGTALRTIIKRCKNAEKVGADGVMVPPPYYYWASEKGLYNLYKALSDALNIGIMLYDQPWQGTKMGPELVGKLIELENVVCMKWDGGTIHKYVEMLELYAHKVSFIDNSLAHNAITGHLFGAHGYITGPANFWPQLEAKFWDCLVKRDYVTAAKELAKLFPFWKFALYRQVPGEVGARSEFGLVGTTGEAIRAAMEIVGLKVGDVRPPFVSFSDAEKQQLASILDQMGVPKYDG